MNEQKMPDMKTIAKKILSQKKYQYLIVVILIAVMLIIYFSSFITEDAVEDEEGIKIIEDYEQTNESNIISEMENILSTIKGAGQVKVMITYETSSELITAMSVENDNQTTYDNESQKSISENTKTDVVTVQNDDGESALVLKEIMPIISGVIVTAEGAGDISVKMNLLEAVTTLLDIPADKVDVFEMNNK